MSDISIQLESNQYYPGNHIRGKAVCYFRSPKEFRKIRIRFQGRENTEWSESESYYDSDTKRNETRNITYTGDRDLVLQDDIVQGEGSLPSGEHTFPINFILPQELPSSFKCEYGGIRYTVQVTVDRPWKSDLEKTVEINMLSPIRLQDVQPSFLRPVELSDEKTVCCLCCAGGNIELQLSLDRRVFAIGPNGNIKVYCENMSNNNVEELNLKLKQKFSYKATVPSTDHKTVSESIATSHNSGVGAHGQKTYSLSLEIPQNANIPNFTRCQLFECTYELKASAVISGCHSDLEVSTDVIVGHIPLPDQSQPYTQPQQKSGEPWNPTGETYDGKPPMPMPFPGDGYGGPSYPILNPSAPSAPPSDAPSTPFNANLIDISTPLPPSYDEAIRGTEKK